MDVNTSNSNLQPTIRIIGLFRKAGVMRSAELTELGVRRDTITRLVRDGVLLRVARGLYMLPDTEITEHHSLAEASKRVPRGVICLLSALRFHGITTQNPFEVWVALPQDTRSPKVSDLPLRFIHVSGEAFTAGVEKHRIENVSVPVYGVAKTVVDCFKFRSTVGVDVAVEALRECRREKLCSVDDIWRHARTCRMTNVIRPYLETTA